MKVGIHKKWVLQARKEKYQSSIVGQDGKVISLSRNPDGSIDVHNQAFRIVRRIVPVFDDVKGRGPGFVIKCDITEKFYFELADAAQAKLDFVCIEPLLSVLNNGRQCP